MRSDDEVLGENLRDKNVGTERGAGSICTRRHTSDVDPASRGMVVRHMLSQSICVICATGLKPGTLGTHDMPGGTMWIELREDGDEANSLGREGVWRGGHMESKGSEGRLKAVVTRWGEQ